MTKATVRLHVLLDTPGEDEGAANFTRSFSETGQAEVADTAAADTLMSMIRSHVKGAFQKLSIETEFVDSKGKPVDVSKNGKGDH